MALRIHTAPTFEPLEVDEVKAHLREDGSDQDAVIKRLITAARLHTEVAARRTFITTTWKLTLDAFPKTILLHRPPISSVSSISYEDADGDTQTLGTSVYQTDFESEPGRIVEAYGQVWPTTRDELNAVTVTYIAGYGATGASVPENYLAAILLLAAHLYENREATIDVALRTVPMAYDSLVWQDRAFRFV